MTKGVTSNCNTARAAAMLTDLDFSMVISSFHGSILIRPPSGSAANTLFSAPFVAGFEDCGCGTAPCVAGVRVPFEGTEADQLLGMRSPKCGLIKFGTSFCR